MDLGGLNGVDIVILLVLLVSGVMATLRGMIREVLGLLGWGVALVVANILAPTIINTIEDAINNDGLTTLIAFAPPFVITLIVWFYLSNNLAPSLKNLTFGSMDRIFGFLFGVVRGVVIVTLIYMLVLAIVDNERDLPESVRNSASIVPMRLVAGGLASLAPGALQYYVEDKIPHQEPADIIIPLQEEGKEAIESGTETLDNTQEELLPDEQLLPYTLE